MIDFIADIVTPREGTVAALTTPCHGCGKPVHIAESTVAVVHFHGVECLRRGRERDKRTADVLEKLFAFGVSLLGTLAFIGAAALLLRAFGAIAPGMRP